MDDRGATGAPIDSDQAGRQGAVARAYRHDTGFVCAGDVEAEPGSAVYIVLVRSARPAVLVSAAGIEAA
jgi:hypothetical protein